MNKIAVTASFALALAGCAAQPFQPPSASGGPTAQVYVVTPAAKRLVVVDPDYIRVTRGQVQNIIWSLSPSGGYSFPDDGIAGFMPLSHGPNNDQPSPPVGNQFGCQKLGPTTFQCRYDNQQPGRYKYTVKLNADDGNNPPPLDPAVGND
jgi:hypothetical protein